MDRNDSALKAALESKLPAAARAEYCDDVVDGIASFFPENIRRNCRVVSVNPGQIVTGKNDARKDIYRLIWGDVSVQRDVLGETVTLWRAGAGDWLIEFGTEQHSADVFAVCERKSVLMAVPRDALFESLDRHPGFAHSWFAEMSAQLARVHRRTERFGLRYAVQRIVHYLMTENSSDGVELKLPFSKRVWAAQMGMSAETLSRALSDMVNAGWLEMLSGGRYRLARKSEPFASIRRKRRQ